MLRPLAILGTLLLMGCADGAAVTRSPSVGPELDGGRVSFLSALRGAGATPASAEEAMPAMRWDHRPEGEAWTEATLVALRSHGSTLPATVPDGIDAWCPAYAEAPVEDREAFWAGLISALSKHESTYRPEAVGGGGRWFGLVQIAPATADGYGCRAQSGDALKDGAANVSCAVRIMAAKAQGGADGVRAIASDWGPFHSAAKREEMRAWVSRQPFCSAA